MTKKRRVEICDWLCEECCAGDKAAMGERR